MMYVVTGVQFPCEPLKTTSLYNSYVYVYYALFNLDKRDYLR